MQSTVTRKKLIATLKLFGFEGPFSGGKHQFMKRDSLKIRIPNPHGSKEIHVSLVKEILRQAGISESDWDNQK